MRYPFALATVAAVVILGGIAGCGGEERLSREEFSDRVQSIGQRGGELWGRLAQRAQDLQPDEPLQADIEQALTALVGFQEEAAAEFEGLNPPESAEDPVELLIAALHQRTETFKQVIEVGRFTRHHFDQVTQSGDEIDQAFEQLREEGFLPTVDEH